MDNKTARKKIKAIMAAIELNYESEQDMRMSFDMYLDSVGLGKPKEVVKEKYSNKKPHEATEFASVHQRKFPMLSIVGMIVGIIGIIGLFVYLINFDKYAVIGSVVAILLGLISLGYFIFVSKNEYYYTYDKGITEEQAKEKAKLLNEQDAAEIKRIDDKYESDLVEYNKKLEVYKNAVSEKKQAYKDFVEGAKKAFELTKKTIEEIEEEIGFHNYYYEDYEQVYRVLVKRPDLDLFEATQLANEIEREREEREHAAYLREQEEQRWIQEQYLRKEEMRAREREADRQREEQDRRAREERKWQEDMAREQREEQRKLAEKERRRQREEQERLEREGRFAALRLCKACANRTHCTAQGHLKTGSCGGFRPS